MKKNTSKYLAALIILLGLILICLIPNCHGNDIFNKKDNTLLLIENIKLGKVSGVSDIRFFYKDKDCEIPINENRMMIGTITALFTVNNQKYKAGQSRVIGAFIPPPNCDDALLPEAALMVIKPDGAEHIYYINDGKLSFNNMSIDTVRGIIQNGK